MFGYKVKGRELLRLLDTLYMETNMYAKKYFKTESKFFNWYNYVKTIEKFCNPGYHAMYIDPEKEDMGFIIYDDEFGQLTPEAQKLYLELEED